MLIRPFNFESSIDGSHENRPRPHGGKIEDYVLRGGKGDKQGKAEKKEARMGSRWSAYWEFVADVKRNPRNNTGVAGESTLKAPTGGAVRRALAHGDENAHTPSMTLKNASLLALIGTVLLTVLLAWDLIVNMLNVGRGLVPAVILISSLIYTFGALSVAVFFFVFHKSQS